MMKRLFLSAFFCAGALAMCMQAKSDPPHEADPVLPAARAQVKGDRFALELFRSLAAEDGARGNITLSPASLEAVLHLLRKGAVGQTRATLDALPMGQQGVKSAMRVESANALFADDSLPLRRKDFADELHRAPLSSNGDKAARAINTWCDDKTHGLVPRIAEARDFTPNTRLVALNAVYLKERWLRPFDEVATRQKGRFVAADGRELTVPLMRHTANFRYAEGKDWQAVALFYRRDGRSGEPGCFIGILPRGDARAFARELTPERYEAIRRALAATKPQRTSVTLPKMDVDSGVFSLRDALCQQGLASLFSRHQADFSGFLEAGSQAEQEGLYLADVKQRCRVIVSEKETQAAAVTMGIMQCRSAAPIRKMQEIHFTRPFIWAIGDLTSEAPPYFLGLCEKP